MVVHNPLKVAGAGSIPAVVTKNCVVCNSIFVDNSPNLSRKYCQRSCASKVHGRASDKKIVGSKLCEECGQSFEYTRGAYRQRFCSRACSARHNNLTHPKRKLEGVCGFCGGPCSSSVKFCSKVCRFNLSEAKFTSWLSGDDWSYVDGTLPARAREFLLEESNNRCSCGWNSPNPVTGRVILTINHIDGNWRNNVRSNLEVLCYNCHTLTPTFGSLNMGSVSGRRPTAGRSN